MAHTYILECSDGSYYVGSTTNLEIRLWQHNNDPEGPIYTRRRRPVRLVWAAEFDSIIEAFEYEKQVQGWNRRKREALLHPQVARDIDDAGRAIGEIDHQERHVAQPHRADRLQKLRG